MAALRRALAQRADGSAANAALLDALENAAKEVLPVGFSAVGHTRGSAAEQRRLWAIEEVARKHSISRSTVLRVARAFGAIETQTVPGGGEVVLIREQDFAVLYCDGAGIINQRSAREALGATAAEFDACQAAASFAPVSRPGATGTRRFLRKDIDDVVAKLLQHAQAATVAPSGTVTLQQAVRATRCSMSDILRLIIDGVIESYFLPQLKPLRSILVDLTQLRDQLGADDGLSLRELANEIGVRHASAHSLAKAGHFRRTTGINPKTGLLRTSFSRDDASEFRRCFIALSEVTRLSGLKRGEVQAWLKDRGIAPAFDPREYSSRIYERHEVAALAPSALRTPNVVAGEHGRTSSRIASTGEGVRSAVTDGFKATDAD